MKRSVREELEYWNAIYVLKRLNRYFNSLHGYERGLRGLSAEDFSMLVLQKILSGERSWEKSSKVDFLSFCLEVMKSEISNFRESPEYTKVISYDLDYVKGIEDRDRWERNGLKDEFNGF